MIAFACHQKYKDADTAYGLPLHSIETITQCYSPSEVGIFVAIGYGKMNKMRQAVYEEIKSMGYRCPTFVHPSVKIWNSTTTGDNVFIFEGNTIQPHTKIGNDTIFWSGNHLGHHSAVGNHCFISSHVVISGSCKIGNNVFIGVNSTFHDGLTIGDECLIGAGAIISRSTKPKEAYVTSATKPFSKTSDEIGF
ncbi:MAG: UDP-N-acetylbacillosamine N-acetyltransferase [Nitrosomonadaceae bacterium]|nr:UDP-N-acetylbacillosamine N-acetyltransferase [Nitrosomonadaceae bacterium]